VSTTDEASAWRARFERERLARKEAERLLTVKSTELYEMNQELERSLTTLRAAQATLVQRERLAAIGALVAGIAHEINTPLGIAVTASSAADETLRTLELDFAAGRLTRAGLGRSISYVREAVGLAFKNLSRAAALVRSFKMVSADEQAEGPRTIDLPEFLSDSITSLQPFLKSHGVTAVIAAPESLSVRASAGPLGQVLGNLVQNACVHGLAMIPPPRVRTVSVVARATETHLELEVGDNGAGIEEQARAHVLEAFYTTKRDSGGTGLGLHIVNNLVTQTFGGTLRFTTETGVGTTWFLQLPWGTEALTRAPARFETATPADE